jgi:ADP-ribose pyrophosphatase YjhB (NUDIX family)
MSTCAHVLFSDIEYIPHIGLGCVGGEAYELTGRNVAPLDEFRYNEALQQAVAANLDFEVRGVVFRDDRILLVKERADGLWTLPGGWADVNESPKEAVVREVVEESGYHTRARKLLAVWDRAKHPHTPPFPYHIYKICILCELMGGEPTESHETEEVGFYPDDGLPELSISRVTPGPIARLYEHCRDPSLQADFD